MKELNRPLSTQVQMKGPGFDFSHCTHTCKDTGLVSFSVAGIKCLGKLNGKMGLFWFTVPCPSSL